MHERNSIFKNKGKKEKLGLKWPLNSESNQLSWGENSAVDISHGKAGLRVQDAAISGSGHCEVPLDLRSM